MLTEAFYEMNLQPHKNAILGPNDVYVLDQQLLKAYVQCIYNEYGIQDPLAPWAHNAQPDSRSPEGTPPTDPSFATPEKGNKARKESIPSNFKTKKWCDKTSERIGKLKKKFQWELRSTSTYLHDHSLGRKIRNDQQRDGVEIGKGSHLLPISHFKYCLMCEKPIEGDKITIHEKSCKKLEKLLSVSNLQIEQILSILDRRIEKIKNELIAHQREFNEDADRIRSIINAEVEKENGCEPLSEQNLFVAFSHLKVIQCLQSLDKLQWFRKMRVKAELKRASLNSV